MRNWESSYWIRFVVTGAFVILSGCQQLRELYPLNKVATNDNNAVVKAKDSIVGDGVVDVHLAWAQSAEERGDLRSAEKAYRDILREFPDDYRPHHRLAVVLDMLGESKQAMTVYQAALARRRNHPELLCDYGYSLYLQKEWSDAETNLRKALELEPNMERAHANLAMLLARTHRVNESLVEFHRAGLTKADAHSNIGIVSMDNGSYAAARHHFQIALQENPKHLVAGEGVGCVDALLADDGQSNERGHTQLAETDVPPSQADVRSTWNQLSPEPIQVTTENVSARRDPILEDQHPAELPIADAGKRSSLPDDTNPLEQEAETQLVSHAYTSDETEAVAAAVHVDVSTPSQAQPTNSPADSALPSGLFHTSWIKHAVNYAGLGQHIEFNLDAEEG